jgi:hypothetical protein
MAILRCSYEPSQSAHNRVIFRHDDAVGESDRQEFDELIVVGSYLLREGHNIARNDCCSGEFRCFHGTIDLLSFRPRPARPKSASNAFVIENRA